MTCILPCAYLAPIDWYMQLRRNPEARVEVCDHYEKQSYRNRCTIAAPDGPLALTIPVVKPADGKTLTRDIRISDHGQWRHLHWNALQTAYRRSPFFEYYADDFEPFYSQRWEFLADFNEALHHTVCSLIDLPPAPGRTTAYEALPPGTPDMRQLIHPRRPATLDCSPYWQVFAHKRGFLPGLSIVDMLFNLGPETILHL